VYKTLVTSEKSLSGTEVEDWAPLSFGRRRLAFLATAELRVGYSVVFIETATANKEFFFIISKILS